MHRKPHPVPVSLSSISKYLLGLKSRDGQTGLTQHQGIGSTDIPRSQSKVSGLNIPIFPNIRLQIMWLMAVLHIHMCMYSYFLLLSAPMSFNYEVFHSEGQSIVTEIVFNALNLFVPISRRPQDSIHTASHRIFKIKSLLMNTAKGQNQSASHHTVNKAEAIE